MVDPMRYTPWKTGGVACSEARRGEGRRCEGVRRRTRSAGAEAGELGRATSLAREMYEDGVENGQEISRAFGLAALELAAALERAGELVRRMRNPTVALIHAWHATARRLEAEAASLRDPRGWRALVRRAQAAARRAVGLARRNPVALPFALREAGLVAALRGRLRRARKRLDQSLAIAARLGARWEHARTLLARGNLGLEADLPGANDDLAAARRALAEMGAGAARGLELRGGGSGGGSGSGREPLATLSLAERFATVLEGGRRIASAITREDVFAAVRESAVALLRAERCCVFAVGAVLEPGVSLARVERAIASGRPVVAGDDGASRTAALRADGGAAPVGARSALCAPVLVHSRPVACLYAAHRDVGGLFGQDEARVAEFVAAIAGAALENAAGFAAKERAEQEVRRMSEALVRGQEDERRRLALALHDGTGQVLAALGMRLKAMAARRAGDAGAAAAADPAAAGDARSLEEMRSLVDRALEELRGLAHDLRPAAIDRVGLAAALRDLAEGASDPSLSVVVRIVREDLGPLPPEVSVALFRIAQAALANVALHARANRARVALVQADGAVRHEVEDDGRGFRPDALPPDAGIGLVGMRERAAWLGGRFELLAAPGRGTRIRVEVPLGGGKEPEGP